MFSKSEKDIRNEKIQKAVPEEKFRKPSPVGNSKWDEENFLPFTGVQKGQTINLHTYKCNTPQEVNIQSVTVFFHGLNEHLGLYAHIAQAISKQGKSVCVGFDQRGFGKSQGIRAWLESQDQLFDDCSRFLTLIKQQYPNKPIFCLGQSMGGLAAYLIGQKKLCNGTILIVPAIMDNYYNQAFMKTIVLGFGLISPTWSPFSDPPVSGSKNPQIHDDNTRDPLIQHTVLPGTARSLIKSMREMPKTFNQYTTPFLIISGGMDQIVDPDVGFELMKLSPSQDKEHLFYENMWHDCVQEEEINDIIPLIVQWILKRST